MTRACLLLLMMLFLFVLPPVAQAQEQPNYASDTAFFTTSRKRVNIPFQFIHNLIVVQVRINGSRPLSLILDSGVKHTIITKLYHTDSLDLNEVNKITIRGLGEGNSIEAFQSSGNEMFMPGIKGVNNEVYVLMEDVFNLSLRMGMPVHGIIGYDIFKNFIVKVNYNSKMITLYPPDTKVK